MGACWTEDPIVLRAVHALTQSAGSNPGNLTNGYSIKVAHSSDKREILVRFQVPVRDIVKWYHRGLISPNSWFDSRYLYQGK